MHGSRACTCQRGSLAQLRQLQVWPYASVACICIVMMMNLLCIVMMNGWFSNKPNHLSIVAIPIGAVKQHQDWTCKTHDGLNFVGTGHTDDLQHMLQILDDAGAFGQRYVVDLGCWMDSNAAADDWYDFGHALMFVKGWAGLCADSEAHMQDVMAKMKQAGRNDIVPLREYVYSDTVERVFTAHGVPKDMGALKIDVDSVDCELLEGILSAGFRPTWIMVEHSPWFPASIRFATRSPSTAATGCSCAQITHIGRMYGYVHVRSETIDIHMVRADVAHHLSPVGRSIVAQGPSCKCNVEYCRNRLLTHVAWEYIVAFSKNNNITNHNINNRGAEACARWSAMQERASLAFLSAAVWCTMWHVKHCRHETRRRETTPCHVHLLLSSLFAFFLAGGEWEALVEDVAAFYSNPSTRPFWATSDAKLMRAMESEFEPHFSVGSTFSDLRIDVVGNKPNTREPKLVRSREKVDNWQLFAVPLPDK